MRKGAEEKRDTEKGRQAAKRMRPGLDTATSACLTSFDVELLVTPDRPAVRRTRRGSYVPAMWDMSDVTYSDTSHPLWVVESGYHVGQSRRKNAEALTSMSDHANRGASYPGCGTPSRSPGRRIASRTRRYVAPSCDGFGVRDEDCMTEDIGLQSLNTMPDTECCRSTAPDCMH